MTTSIDKDIIEKVKSILLVVLTISTILLLYFFWGNMSFDDLNLIDKEEEYQTIAASDLLEPSQIIVSLEQDSYQLLQPEAWQRILGGIEEYVTTDTLILEEITKEQYDQVTAVSSVRVIFQYPLPLKDLFLANGIKNSTSFDNVANVTEIGYGSVSKESLLLYDSSKGRYYRLITSSKAYLLEEFLSEAMLGTGPVYFKLGTYLGGEVDNDTLIPVMLETNIRNLDFNRETFTNQKDELASIAQSFFGKTFDFIRKIEEGNGTVIYMYGYGQKVLIVNKNGIIEYKEESTSTSADSGYLESLQTALNFISGHGAFESMEGSVFTPYIKNVLINPEDRKGYRFVFGIMINGNKLHYQDQDPFIVEVVKNQVTYFRRDLSEYDVEYIQATRENFKEAYSSINMLAQNYEYFTGAMGLSGTFEEISQGIRSVEPGYVVAREEDEIAGKALAAWIVSFEKQEAYFDLYTAEPIGFKRNEQKVQ